MSLLSVKGLVKRFGGFLATDHLDFEVEPGELHAIIGPNGAGKTTLINQLSGELQPSEGRILLNGRDVTRLPVNKRALSGIARSYQITSVFMEFTVLQNVVMAVQAAEGHSFMFWQPVLSDARLVEPARELLATVGLEQQANICVGILAHGARRQLEIAMTLAMRPKLLLLDEPMAGMSRHESLAVVELLQKLKGRYAIVLVEHDMDAIFALADRISVLVYGKRIACGTAEEIRSNADVRTAYLGDQEEMI
ncbi:ABC transporter ATP-binding protein [Glaciimonas immobilis]|uniref:Branched-chain amino acid transport system ATP-binding protein n=1 Tax=Glaciimonas immobilis TaxID=728004 RepID=A0A840RRJ9_9BURK|nr:ABC transporter ATP-binding protein [Glaciimonas immobilis]KAF3998177.1 ABC transporter ATP-binding protein [Glaciimonas immobilis]MBB5199109.1 branched-chain amino acid transport system ATP-binding protein [Glaciimonas immobilis]